MTEDRADDMSCNELVELVTDFLEGELDLETERRFVDHLAQCDGCDRYLDQVRGTIAAVGAQSADPLPEETRAALLAAFRATPDQPEQPPV
jgi:anti-sigma factor RsiW